MSIIMYAIINCYIVSSIIFTLGKCQYINEHHEFPDITPDFTLNQPKFTQKTYTALIDGVSFILTDPIVLNNCGLIDSFQIDASQSYYVPINNDRLSVTKSENCTLMFPRIFIKRDNVEKSYTGFITVKALHKNHVLDATSVVLLENTESRNVRMIFEMDGVEYIIINYFYLKVVFLGLLLTTLLLVVIEVREFVEKMKENKYKTLENCT